MTRQHPRGCMLSCRVCLSPDGYVRVCSVPAAPKSLLFEFVPFVLLFAEVMSAISFGKLICVRVACLCEYERQT
jgi:hypothetical protein